MGPEDAGDQLRFGRKRLRLDFHSNPGWASTQSLGLDGTDGDYVSFQIKLNSKGLIFSVGLLLASVFLTVSV